MSKSKIKQPAKTRSRLRQDLLRQMKALVKIAVETDDMRVGTTCITLAAALGWATKYTSEENILLCISGLAEYVQEERSKKIEVASPQIIQIKR